MFTRQAHQNCYIVDNARKVTLMSHNYCISQMTVTILITILILPSNLLQVSVNSEYNLTSACEQEIIKQSLGCQDHRQASTTMYTDPTITILSQAIQRIPSSRIDIHLSEILQASPGSCGFYRNNHNI